MGKELKKLTPRVLKPIRKYGKFNHTGECQRPERYYAFSESIRRYHPIPEEGYQIAPKICPKFNS